MPKLIRLLGDSTTNATEIRNTFRQPIIVKPYSKVALVGASAYIADDVANESFKIFDDNSKFFKCGETGNKLDCTLTAGTYTGFGLIDEFATAANFSGTSTQGIGIHHQTKTDANQFVLETYKSLYSLNDFSDATEWTVTGTTATGSGTATSGASSSLISDLGSSTVPMVHNKFGVTLTTISGENTFACIDTYTAVRLFGFEISGGTYYKIINDTRTSLSATWAAGDVATMETYAGGYYLTVDSSAGASKINHTATLSRAIYSPTKIGGYRWTIDMENSSKIDSCRATTVYGAGGIQTLKDSNCNAVLQFKTPSDKVNVVLGQYLGFGSDGGSDIAYSGNPATVSGRTGMSGFLTYPGIIVALDGLGPLQSFDGGAKSRAPDNIIYVLNDLKQLSNNLLQVDIPSPFYLDLNNPQPINVNELRARFLPATGYEENPVLSFLGNPSLTLLIDG